MVIKRFSEQELLEGLDGEKAHADERAEPLSQELEPLDKLKGSVKKYVQPFDGVWDDCFDDQGQPLPGKKPE